MSVPKRQDGPNGPQQNRKRVPNPLTRRISSLRLVIVQMQKGKKRQYFVLAKNLKKFIRNALIYLGKDEVVYITVAVSKPVVDRSKHTSAIIEHIVFDDEYWECKVVWTPAGFVDEWEDPALLDEFEYDEEEE